MKVGQLELGQVELGQVERPYTGLEPWTVASTEPNPDDPHTITVTLRNAKGEQRSDPEDRRKRFHGDWPGGTDPDDGVAGSRSAGRARSGAQRLAARGAGRPRLTPWRWAECSG